MSYPKITLLLLALICAEGLFAQSSTENYVSTSVAREEGYTTDLASEQDHTKVSRTTQYYDGLGREKQTVFRKGSFTGKDVVSNVTYDAMGRVDKTYLPFSATNSTPGNYHSGWTSGISSFYSSTSNKVANESTHYYSQSIYEDSPLAQPDVQYGPGSAWRTQNKGVLLDYLNNQQIDNVRHFSVHGQASTLIYNGVYANGMINVLKVTDENGGVTLEYTDKRGHLVCKRVYVDATNYADTYYVYNTKGQLRFVLPPEFNRQGFQAPPQSNYIEANTNLTAVTTGNFHYKEGVSVKLKPGFGSTSFSLKPYQPYATGSLDLWAFQYQYDKRGHMIAKRVPGSDWVYMVYDKWDRLVLTQDGEQRKTNTWLYTKYDFLNRPVMTGKCVINRTLSQVRSDAENSTLARYESYSATSTPHKYTTINAYPRNGLNSVILPGSDILSVTYYDNYNFASDWAGYGAPSGYETKVKGQVTGGQIRQLTGNLLKSATYYDSRYRVMKTISEHHLGSTDQVTTEYYNNVSARVKKVTRSHKKGSATNNIIEEFTYDHADRVTVHKTTISGTQVSGSKISTINHVYNELGELVDKNIIGAQSIDYRYNIRGWLRTINGGTGFNSVENDKFGMELVYDGVGQYNGNIGRMNWRSTASSGDNGTKKYDFTYDKMNRLTSALYNNDLSGDDDYDVTGITYDLNGNIQTMTRRFNNTNADLLDYDYSGNRLTSVGDSYTSAQGFDETRSEGKAANEYLYDANGNMIEDKNKGITVSYNHLNLPSRVDFTANNDHILYTYDAAGTKLKKVSSIGSNTTTTDYIAGIQYENGNLDFAMTAEGKFKFTTDVYEYDLKDHLGNTRVTVNESGNAIQRQDYYPFGLTFNSYTSGTKNNYLYNQGIGDKTFQGLVGKEFKTERQSELQVDLTKYRTYDYALGRWWQVDPLADSLESFSPYNGMDNNPVRFNDPEGDCGPLCATALAGAAIGGLVGAGLAIYEGADAKGVAAAALGGAVSGAVIGSGAFLLSAPAAAVSTTAAALSSSVPGTVATLAATGAVAGVGEELTKQAVAGEGINTAKVVEAGAAGALVNVVAGPAGKVLDKAIGTSGIGQTVANKVVKPTVEVVKETVGKVVENVVQDELDHKPEGN